MKSNAWLVVNDRSVLWLRPQTRRWQVGFAFIGPSCLHILPPSPQVLWLPPTVKNMPVRWIGTSKLSVGSSCLHLLTARTVSRRPPQLWVQEEEVEEDGFMGGGMVTGLPNYIIVSWSSTGSLEFTQGKSKELWTLVGQSLQRMKQPVLQIWLLTLWETNWCQKEKTVFMIYYHGRGPWQDWQAWLLGASWFQPVCKPHCCGRVSRDSKKKVKKMLTVPESHTKQKALHHSSEWSAYEEGRWSLANAVTKCHCCYVMSKLRGCDQRGDLARWQSQSCLWKHSLKNKQGT